MAARNPTKEAKSARNGRANGTNGVNATNGATVSTTANGLDISLLKQLTETPGVAGREERVRAVVVEQLRPLVDELSVDALGNVIAVKKGKGKSKRRVMLAAHMDEIGFLVRYIEKDGWLRVQPLGGFDPRVLVAQRVLVHTSAGETLRGAFMPATRPIHLLEGKPEPAKLEEFYIDLGMPGDQVRERVAIGDFVTMDRTLEQIGDCVISKALDDRTGLFVMIEALRRLGEHDVTVVAVATVQEEVGLRGATTSAYTVDPDVAVALDTTIALDVPGTPEADAVTRLGGGAAIKVFDSSAIPNFKLVRHLRAVAERHDIAHQMEVLPRGGTDAGAMQRTRAGTAAITLSIPSRYVHTVDEMVHTRDVDAAATLLARYLEDAHTGDYAL